jgi:GDP-L-fucose synthase
MKVFVTGATGFLGRHLIKKLKGLGYSIYESNSKHCNLHDYDNLCTELHNVKFDYIFHLAAMTKAGDYCLYHKGEQWIDNQLLNTNALKFWANKQPQAKLIAMGTSCMYEPSENQLKEKSCMLGTPEEGLITYAHTKRMLLVGLQSLAHQYNLNYLYFIPSTLYGDNFDLNDNHFIFDLVKKIYNGKYNNSKVTLWGNGLQKRELIYVEDAIDIILKLKDKNNKIINLGTGQDNTIQDFARCISNNLNFDPEEIFYDITKYTGAKRKILCIDNLLSLIGKNYKFTSIEEGISNIIEYYKKSCK